MHIEYLLFNLLSIADTLLNKGKGNIRDISLCIQHWSLISQRWLHCFLWGHLAHHSLHYRVRLFQHRGTCTAQIRRVASLSKAHSSMACACAPCYLYCLK